MNRRQRNLYHDPELLRDILRRALSQKKFRLDCGHLVTFNQFLGNDIIVRNGSELRFICTECGY